MRWQVAIVLLVAVSIPSVGDQPTDYQKIQGYWVLVDTEDDGRKASKEELSSSVWSLVGAKYTIRRGNDVREGTFKIDPAMTPKTFDRTGTAGADKGKSYRGIYKFVGDELVLCLARDEKADRPKEFTGKAGSGQIIMLFKRKGP